MCVAAAKATVLRRNSRYRDWRFVCAQRDSQQTALQRIRPDPRHVRLSSQPSPAPRSSRHDMLAPPLAPYGSLWLVCAVPTSPLCIYAVAGFLPVPVLRATGLLFSRKPFLNRLLSVFM